MSRRPCSQHEHPNIKNVGTAPADPAFADAAAHFGFKTVAECSAHSSLEPSFTADRNGAAVLYRVATIDTVFYLNTFKDSGQWLLILKVKKLSTCTYVYYCKLC